MKLKNILFVVKDIEKSKAFYKELFGLEVVTDFGENVILTEGLVLQEKQCWESFINKKVSMGGNDAELYFEENNIDIFIEKLEKSSQPVCYVHENMEHEWGQRVIRLYDPDGHVIEVREALDYVARRYLKEGLSVEQVAKKVRLPPEQVRAMVFPED